MGAAGAKSKLTEEEKQTLRSSWELAMKNRGDFSVDIFYRVFQESPAAKDFFEQFRGLPLEELRIHPVMKAHCLRVSGILNNVLLEFEDQALVLELIRNVARTHYHYGKNIDKTYYDLFGKALMEAFENQLKGKFDTKARNAWSKAYGAMEEILLATKSQLDK